MCANVIHQMKLVIQSLQLESKFFSYGNEKDSRLQHRVGQVGNHLILGQGLKEATAKQRLASSHLASDFYESLARGQANQQGIQRCLMRFAGINKTGVWRQAEREFSQAKMV
jgi:hypothetical protein